MKKIWIFAFSAMLAACTGSTKELSVTVENLSAFDRQHEIAEIGWNKVQQKLSLSGGRKIIVTDGSGQQIPYQLITNGTDSVVSLIFPVTLNAGETGTFRITTGEPDDFPPMVYGRLVPERKDDFTWENNRVAFRVYGPALQATGEISNGMDFWAKRTELLVIDKWYENDLSGKVSYHEDHGEGLDFYKVGRTLGLGMTAPVHNDTLCLGKNFTRAQLLDNGPLRITFKLDYDPYDAGGRTVTETRIISLDAYDQLNKVTNIFETDTTLLTVGTGIVMEENTSENTYGVNHGIIAYKVPEDSVNGTIYTGAVHPKGFGIVKISNGHFLGLNSYEPGAPYMYYAGGGWSKAGFNNFEEWIDYLALRKKQLDNPLKIEIQ